MMKRFQNLLSNPTCAATLRPSGPAARGRRPRCRRSLGSARGPTPSRHRLTLFPFTLAHRCTVSTAIGRASLATHLIGHSAHVQSTPLVSQHTDHRHWPSLSGNAPQSRGGIPGKVKPVRSVAAPIVTIGAAASVVAQIKSEGAHQNRTQKYLPSQLTGSLHSKQTIVQGSVQNSEPPGAMFA